MISIDFGEHKSEYLSQPGMKTTCGETSHHVPKRYLIPCIIFNLQSGGHFLKLWPFLKNMKHKKEYIPSQGYRLCPNHTSMHSRRYVALLTIYSKPLLQQANFKATSFCINKH